METVKEIIYIGNANVPYASGFGRYVVIIIR